MTSRYLVKFKENFDNGQPSILTLMGAGPNGFSQFPLLNKIGADRLRNMTRIDIMSASAISFFFYLAAQEGAVKIDGYKCYESILRKIHKGSFWKALMHTLTLGWSKKSYFSNELLPCVFSQLFTAEFHNRKLGQFAHNIVIYCWDYNANKVRKITPKTHPEMTVADVCRASMSIPFLHGAYHYQNMVLVDPLFTPYSKHIQQSVFTTEKNQLCLNMRKSGEHKGIVYVKNNRYTTKASVVWGYAALCLGIPNLNIRATLANNLTLVRANQAMAE